MKLIDRYNRISLLVTIAIIIVTGFVYYLTISYILTNRVDRDLLVEENEIFAYVKLNKALPQVFKSDGLKIRFVPSATDDIARSFGNAMFYNEEENEQEAGRMLTSSVKVGGKTYRIEIIESKVETEYLIRFIFFITLGIILVLLTLLLIINRILVRRLWKPFYRILEGIKLFNLADKNGINPVTSDIDEFRDLNVEVTAMSGRVMNDYQSLKGFVENAAHELMTPLAVINSKLDTLMQVGEMTDKQGEIISEVYHTVGRLKKLNRSMLLLSRIENKLMAERETIDLAEFIDDKLNEFQELLAERGIGISKDLKPCPVTINRDLLTVMLNNLLGNAILHNTANGQIEIRLNQNELVISNTGANTALNEQKVLQRFYKSPESEGSGLGLTLVKEICDSYGYLFGYSFEAGLHLFEIKFQ
ncbi:sensor histidine kinase [Mucilaginibacter conchicola]|uniref:histidine kinase n=1 Tax=Mucilaginibacter conchicola TaxID=2303333 RepID=A0A372NZN1_9SPHI|nr:HAMP domain-containing sensor histidine kinase [Mucilaginibacter conchicola]RFZ95585.1 sensor histidine kinase [Mucilaginibacter conchicola]